MRDTFMGKRTPDELDSLVRAYLASGKHETTDREGNITMRWRRHIAKELCVSTQDLGRSMNRVILALEVDELR